MKIKLLIILLLGLAAAACAPAPTAAPVSALTTPEEKPAAAPPPPQPPPERYRVKKGDTLIGIAMSYDLDHRELARWNNLRNPDLIKPGQVLRFVPPASEPVAAAVPVQQAPALKSIAPAEAAAAAPAAVQRQSTIIGGQAATPAPAPGTAPYKTAPQARKYAYSPAMLKKLQSEWRKQAPQAPKAAAPRPAPAAPAAAAAAPAQAAAAGKTRQRYDITWGLPSPNPVLQRYSSVSKGVDFSGKTGDPVYAAADGTVIYVGTGVKSYGRLVILRHKNNYLSAYAHNNSILVKEDQRVTRGSKIATMGSSGSERVMLHFEVRKGGKPLDPAQVLPQ